MRNRSLDLALVVLLTCIALLLPLRPPVSTPFALLLVLYLPGYALTSAVFAYRTLDRPERTLFSMGLSLAITAISGLALHLTGLGIRTEYLSALLGGIALISAAAAWLQRSRIIFNPPPARARLDLTGIFLLILSGFILAIAIAIARTTTPPGGFQGYTLLWIGNGEAGSPGTYQIGIQSQEFTTMGFSLRVAAGGEDLKSISSFQLKPGETLEITEPLPAWVTPQIPIEAQLFRLAEPAEPYRRVVLWPDG